MNERKKAKEQELNAKFSEAKQNEMAQQLSDGKNPGADDALFDFKLLRTALDNAEKNLNDFNKSLEPLLLE